MLQCRRDLCVLGPGFRNLTLEDQAAMVLACRIADAEAYRTCEARHRQLVDWVEDVHEPPAKPD